MEFIKQQIRDFWHPEEKELREAQAFFDTERGQKLKAKVMARYGINKTKYEKVKPSLIDYKPRLVIEITPVTFRRLVQRIKPRSIYYPSIRQFDEGTSGFLVVRAAGKVEIIADGYINDQWGTGMLDTKLGTRYVDRPGVLDEGKFILPK